MAALRLAALALAVSPPAAGLAATSTGHASPGAQRCTIVGTPHADRLHGTRGDDVICGRGGGDRLYGGAGNDLLIGGRGDDSLYGGPGDDVLAGGAGSDLCRDSDATPRRGCERGRRSTAPFPDPTIAGLAGDANPVDTEPPSLVLVSFDGRLVDTSAGDTQMGFTVSAYDPSGIGQVELRVDGPGGEWRDVRLQGNPERDPRIPLEGAVDVPASTPPGDYRIVSAKVVDGAGNSRTLDAVELTGPEREFEAFQGPDVAGPELTGFSLTPTEVESLSPPTALSLAIEARDAAAGVKGVSAIVRSPDAEPSVVRVNGSCATELPPEEGTRHDGKWDLAKPLGEEAVPGYYAVTDVYLCDLAGNWTHYGQSQLEALGFATEALWDPGGDTTPPEVLDFHFEPSTLHTSAGERWLSFYLHVRDDITGFGEGPRRGLSRIEVGFEPDPPPLEFSFGGHAPELLSGSILDGVWRQELALEEDAPSGDYEVTYVVATDRAGNTTTLTRADLEARGWQHSFYNQP